MKDKETKKGLFGTAGRKAGAKIRHKLKNKEEDSSKMAPQTSSSPLPPSPNNDEIDDQGKKPPFNHTDNVLREITTL